MHDYRMNYKNYMHTVHYKLSGIIANCAINEIVIVIISHFDVCESILKIIWKSAYMPHLLKYDKKIKQLIIYLIKKKWVKCAQWCPARHNGDTHSVDFFCQIVSFRLKIVQNLIRNGSGVMSRDFVMIFM